jgi:hypothetical protein
MPLFDDLALIDCFVEDLFLEEANARLDGLLPFFLLVKRLSRGWL